jgi:hypothetical protein
MEDEELDLKKWLYSTIFINFTKWMLQIGSANNCCVNTQNFID